MNICITKFPILKIYIYDIIATSTNYYKTLANLGHFATAISMLLRRYVVDIATNLESLKHRFMSRGNCGEFELPSQ